MKKCIDKIWILAGMFAVCLLLCLTACGSDEEGKTDETVLPPVSRLTAERGFGEIILRWVNPQIADLSHVTVEYALPGTGAQSLRIDAFETDGNGQSTGTVTISVPDRNEYLFTVKVHTVSGQQSEGVSVRASARLSTAVCDAILETVVMEAADNSVSVHWENPDRVEVVIKVNYAERGRNLSKRINAGETGSASITGFERPFSEIDFTVSVTDDYATSTYTRTFTLSPIDVGEGPSTATFRIGSFNVLFNRAVEDPNDDWAWVNRRLRFFQLLDYCDFDLISTQEVTTSQSNDITKNLPQYSISGTVYYKRSRFTKLDDGTFYFSETPDQYSSGWDAAQPNSCSWVYLQDKSTGITFYFYSLHFDAVGVIARVESAKLMVKMMTERAGNKQAFCAGDFNSHPNSEAISIMRAKYTDVFDVAETVDRGDGRTYNGGNIAGSGSWIDYIFMNNKDQVTVKQAAVINMLIDGKLVSDHFPLLAEVVLSRQ
jgi:endonuclease/exonuclease/phosphatase family metal-dependent hydrolase